MVHRRVTKKKGAKNETAQGRNELEKDAPGNRGNKNLPSKISDYLFLSLEKRYYRKVRAHG